jgi:hypothetical protein
MGLRDWSGNDVLVAGLAWAGLFTSIARAFRRPLLNALWPLFRDRPISPGRMTAELICGMVLLVLGPPLALTAAWAQARRRADVGATAPWE